MYDTTGYLFSYENRYRQIKYRNSFNFIIFSYINANKHLTSLLHRFAPVLLLTSIPKVCNLHLTDMAIHNGNKVYKPIIRIYRNDTISA